MEDLGYPFETLGSAKIVSWSGHSEDGVPTGSGFVCARQKWVVCARQTVGRLCTFLLCVFVIVSLQHDSSSSFFSTSQESCFRVPFGGAAFVFSH